MFELEYNRATKSGSITYNLFNEAEILGEVLQFIEVFYAIEKGKAISIIEPKSGVEILNIPSKK